MPYFEQTIAPDGRHVIEERETIAGRPTLDSMVTLPASLTAVAWTMATGSGSALLGIIGRYYGGWDIPTSILVPTVAFLSTLVGSVVYAYKQAELFDAYTDMMIVYERTIKPLDSPPPPPQAVFVQAGNQTTRLPDEPRPGALRHFAIALLRGDPFNEATATRLGYARDSWAAIRDFAVTAGWAYWRDDSNHRLGLELSGAGKAWLRNYADHPPTLDEGRSFPNA